MQMRVNIYRNSTPTVRGWRYMANNGLVAIISQKYTQRREAFNQVKHWLVIEPFAELEKVYS
jgi:hypothetical protein